MDMKGFYEGKIFDAYEYLGCHIEKNCAVFRTFAPNADKISLIGDFNSWQETKMEKIYDGNFWECRIDNAEIGMKYKYRIYEKQGRAIDHCDPFGYGMELRPNTASVICDIDGYTFSDAKWMKNRTDCKDAPLNIYEMHAGSWKKKSETETGWYNYAELAELLIPYLKENGYNYLEFMPLAEHPSDNSWGYQATGFYSPTSRYGTADDLKKFVDLCHQNSIGVILDYVPVHFAVDDYALANYDGTALYEYPNQDIGYSEWGSKNFMHSRGEVQSFLQSNANYWLKEYHFDGLRMDAISNIIYWQGNKERGVNANAVQFIKRMNTGLKTAFPSAILVAEDSTAYPGVTKAVSEGGLGFDYKWNMGWMNDTLQYMQESTQERVRDYYKLTFSMTYFYDESFLLPLSHDEVVHGKATIVQKMNGEYEVKFAQARALYAYMYTHPGKKLNFMGNELGQLREWDEKRAQDWDILRYPMHNAFHRFICDLNQLYLSNPALYVADYQRDGFQWIDCHLQSDCIYSFKRIGKAQEFVVIMNFSETDKEYSFDKQEHEKYQVLFSTDDCKYGGSEKTEMQISAKNVQMILSAFTVVILSKELK